MGELGIMNVKRQENAPKHEVESQKANQKEKAGKQGPTPRKDQKSHKKLRNCLKVIGVCILVCIALVAVIICAQYLIRNCPSDCVNCWDQSYDFLQEVFRSNKRCFECR